MSLSLGDLRDSEKKLVQIVGNESKPLDGSRGDRKCTKGSVCEIPACASGLKPCKILIERSSIARDDEEDLHQDDKQERQKRRKKEKDSFDDRYRFCSFGSENLSFDDILRRVEMREEAAKQLNSIYEGQDKTIPKPEARASSSIQPSVERPPVKRRYSSNNVEEEEWKKRLLSHHNIL